MSQEASGPEPRRLLRSRRDRMIAGVCGGLASYLGIDPVLVRVATVVLAFASGGIVVLAYVVGWIVMPEGEGGGRPRAARAPDEQPRKVIGGVLVAAGVLWFDAMLIPGFFDVRVLGPLVFIAIGAVLLVQAAGR